MPELALALASYTTSSLDTTEAAWGSGVDDRRVINGMLWRFRTGAPWRDVPERYGRARRFTTASCAGGPQGSSRVARGVFRSLGLRRTACYRRRC